MVYKTQTKMTHTTPQTKADFKEAYYVIGDKIVTLEMMKEKMTTPRARKQLEKLVNDFNVLHSNLKNFGNEYIKNWD